VPTYDWTDFFAPHLKKVASIKKYHHFRCDFSQSGVVFVKEHANTDEKIDLVKCTQPWLPDPNDLPSLVPPKYLSAERQWYLYESIRPFCPDSDKDTTCPLPDVPRPGSAPVTPDRRTQPHTEDSEPPPKRKRLCGTCRQGHNHCSCPNREA